MPLIEMHVHAVMEYEDLRYCLAKETKRCQGCAFDGLDRDAEEGCAVVVAESNSLCQGGFIWVPVEYQIPIQDRAHLVRFCQALHRMDHVFHPDDDAAAVMQGNHVMVDPPVAAMLNARMTEARAIPGAPDVYEILNALSGHAMEV